MYHKHKNLKAQKIKDLASDANIAAKASDVVGKTLDAITDAVFAAAVHNRRLNSVELQKVVSLIEQTFENEMMVIASRFFDQPPTRTRPKGEEFERNYVVVSNFDRDIFTIFSVRFHVSRRGCSYICSELPIAFTYHCAERLMERGKGITQAAKEISFSLMEMLLFSKLVEPLAKEYLNDSLILPAIELDGGFLGGFQDYVPYDFRLLFKDGEYMKPYQSGITAPRRYLAKTFVHDKQLGRKQDEILDAIFDWRAECDIVHEQAIIKELWPETRMTEEEKSIKGLGIGHRLTNYLKSPKVVEYLTGGLRGSRCKGKYSGGLETASLNMAI